MFFPNLTTDRLLLREVRETDATFLFRHLSDPDVCRYLLDEEPYTTIDEAEALVRWYSEPEGKTNNRWIIVEKESEEPIGTCGFSRWDK